MTDRWWSAGPMRRSSRRAGAISFQSAPMASQTSASVLVVETEETRKKLIAIFASSRDLQSRESMPWSEFVAKAQAAGLVAFDTETDALGSATAGLCGISLAVAPGEVGHVQVKGESGERQLDFHQKFSVRLVVRKEKPRLAAMTAQARLFRMKFPVAPCDAGSTTDAAGRRRPSV